MLESLFNKVAGLKACNFIKKRLQHGCFPVSFKNILMGHATGVLLAEKLLSSLEDNEIRLL